MFGTKTERIKELEEQLKMERREFNSKSKILEAELNTRVTAAIADEKAKNDELKLNNAVLRKQVEILEKAFENMGFDVKDMKEILNKLVDGVIAKGQIQLLKTK